MNKLDDKTEMIWNIIFGENFTVNYIVPFLHEQKLAEQKSIMENESLTISQKITKKNYVERCYNADIKDKQLVYKSFTRQFLDVARHKSVLSFVELGTDLYCDLSRILKRRVDFAENVLKENYKVGLLKKDINGTIDIEGEKYTLIV